MAFQQQINVMDYAKKEGKQRRIADVLQDLASQQAGISGEMGKYKQNVGGVDLASNLLASKGTDMFLDFLLKGVGTSNPFLGLGFLAGKSALKYYAGDKISGGLQDILKIKAPEAPTVDMSKLTGPGMSGARKTIADALEVSDAGYEGEIGDIGQYSQLINLIMSISPSLKEKIPNFGGKGIDKSIMDYFNLGNLFNNK